MAYRLGLTVGATAFADLIAPWRPAGVEPTIERRDTEVLVVVGLPATEVIRAVWPAR